MAFVFNVPRYALGLPLAPQARDDDGLLDLCLFQRGSPRDLVRYFWALLRGAHTGLPDVQCARAARFRIQSDQPVPVQLDGDFFGWLPVELSVRRAALPVLIPPGWNGFAARSEHSASRQEVPCSTIR
jgi:diacylglycerol kinase family enzyme